MISDVYAKFGSVWRTSPLKDGYIAHITSVESYDPHNSSWADLAPISGLLVPELAQRPTCSRGIEPDEVGVPSLAHVQRGRQEKPEGPSTWTSLTQNDGHMAP